MLPISTLPVFSKGHGTARPQYETGFTVGTDFCKHRPGLPTSPKLAVFADSLCLLTPSLFGLQISANYGQRSSTPVLTGRQQGPWYTTPATRCWLSVGRRKLLHPKSGNKPWLRLIVKVKGRDMMLALDSSRWEDSHACPVVKEVVDNSGGPPKAHLL